MLIKELKRKLHVKHNTKNLIIDSQKEEIYKLTKKINEKNELIMSLYYMRDDLQNKIKELLEENEELRRKKIKNEK